MAVHWFPGHMHKALKEIKEKIRDIDIVLEVLDARIPYSSENPEVRKLTINKPTIKIFNKSDLADPIFTKHWQTFLEKSNKTKTLSTQLNEPKKLKELIALIREMCAVKNESAKNINAMIMGIPNVGKSSLINTLAGRVIAKTGNEPAVTKSQQRIKLGNGITLFDTPGVLWPKLINPNTGYRLAASGAVKDTAIDYEDVGFFAAEFLLERYPEYLKRRFDLVDLGNSEIDFLENVAKKRGAIMSGGKVNLHKTCELLIHELRAAKIGRVTLETPELISDELAVITSKKVKQDGKIDARF